MKYLVIYSNGLNPESDSKFESSAWHLKSRFDEDKFKVIGLYREGEVPEPQKKIRELSTPHRLLEVIKSYEDYPFICYVDSGFRIGRQFSFYNPEICWNKVSMIKGPQGLQSNIILGPRQLVQEFLEMLNYDLGHEERSYQEILNNLESDIDFNFLSPLDYGREGSSKLYPHGIKKG